MSMVDKPGYKETNIGWIPKDWQLSQLSAIADINPSRTRPESDKTEVTFLAMGDVSEKGGILNRQIRCYQDVAKGFTSFSNDDVLVAKITPCFENGKGALATQLLGGIGFGSTEFHVIRPKAGVSFPPFVHLHTRYEEFRRLGEKNMVGSAGQRRVPTAFLRNYPIPLPSYPEQQKIAAILTSVDEKLDVITCQIASTETLKQGLMQTLFNRGVGSQDANGRWVPHTEFKDSEHGKIPFGWSAEKLDLHVSKVGSGVTPKGGSDAYLASGIPLIRSQNVLVGRLSLDDVVFISNDQHQKMRNSALAPKDVLLNITGASIGRCAILPADFNEGNVNQHVCIIRPLASLNPYFLCHYLNSDFGQKQVGKFQAGGNREGLNYQQIRSFDLPVPPVEEQEKIAQILDGVDAKLESLSAKQTHYQTLKRGLMQKLLTGEWRVKLDSAPAPV